PYTTLFRSDLDKLEWPEDLRFMRERLIDVGRQTVDLVTAFVDAARSPDNPIDLYRALRRFARIQETLYPLAPAFEPVSRWFLEPARRDDDALVARLRDGALRDDQVRVGVLHASNERDERGGFSVYVPEDSDGRTPMPLVVALHGGHGHGRDFLWSWLADARSRGVLLMAPTSRDRTWSIMGLQDSDAEGLRQMVESVAERYPVDRSRVLLTGMSDGATYALLCGLRDAQMPFTHLAAAPPLRLEDHARRGRARVLALPLREGECLVDVREREAVRDHLRERILVPRPHQELERARHDPRVVVHEPRPLDLLRDHLDGG